MDRHAIDFFDLFADPETGTLEAQGSAPSSEVPLETAGLPPVDEERGGALPYVPDPVAPLLWPQEAIAPQPEEPAAGPVALDIVAPPPVPAAPLVIAAPPVDGAAAGNSVAADAGSQCGAESEASVGAAPPVEPLAAEPATNQNPYGIATPNAIALAAKAAAEQSGKVFAQPVDLIAAFLEHAPFLAHEEDEASESAASPGAAKPKAPLQSSGTDDKTSDSGETAAVPLDAAVVAALPLPANNVPPPDAPQARETPSDIETQATTSVTATGGTEATVAAASVAADAAEAGSAAAIVAPMPTPNMVPRSPEAIRNTPSVPSLAPVASENDVPAVTSAAPPATNNAPAETVDRALEALPPLASSPASTDSPAAAAPRVTAPHKKTNGGERPEAPFAPPPSIVPVAEAAADAVAPPVTVDAAATAVAPPVAAADAAPRAAAAASPNRSATLSPLAAEIAALAAASAADHQPGGSGSSSSDEQRREQPRSHAAEPAAAVAHRLAQTVQLMAGFERVLESAAPAATAAATAPPVSLPNEPQVMSTILKSMHLQYQNGVGSAVITLDPEYLGGVTVSLQLSHGAVTASLEADRADVRAWLDANQHTLREALGQQGLSLDRLIISDARQDEREPPSDERRQQSRQQQPPRNSRKRREDEPAAFEVVV